MSDYPIPHTFILSDDYNLSAKKIKMLGEETAFRRANDIGWEDITVTKIPLVIKRGKNKIYLFQIQGRGEIMEDHEDVILIKKILSL